MAKEMSFDNGVNTAQLWGAWVNSALQFWDLTANDGAGGWVDAVSVTLANCTIEMTHLVAGLWQHDAPEGIDLTQSYTVYYYASATPAMGTQIGQQDWALVKLASDGLDAVDLTPPTAGLGWANWTFRHVLVMLGRLFFGPAKETGTTRTVYADDGTTVLTTQTIGDDGTTQTQGRVP